MRRERSTVCGEAYRVRLLQIVGFRSPVILLGQKKKNATPNTAYARSKKAPSSQFDSASLITDDTTPTDRAMLATSIVLKARSIGW